MNEILPFPTVDETTAPPKAADKPTWKVSKCAVVGAEAVVEFRRSEHPGRQFFDDTNPEFGEVFREFQGGEVVERYQTARAALLEAVELASKAAATVADSEQSIVGAAGLGKAALSKADASHEKALNDHGRLAKRVVLLRESTEQLWTELRQKLDKLGEQTAHRVFTKANEAIKIRQATIAEQLGPMLDEIGFLTLVRERAAAYRFQLSDLKLPAPPKADGDE